METRISANVKKVDERKKGKSVEVEEDGSRCDG